MFIVDYEFEYDVVGLCLFVSLCMIKLWVFCDREWVVENGDEGS